MSNTVHAGSACEAREASCGHLVRLAGVALALTGVAHFVLPALFRRPTGLIFPDDPARAVRINGTSETLIGAAIAYPKTRRAGLGALAIYSAYLAASGIKAVTRRRAVLH